MSKRTGCQSFRPAYHNTTCTPPLELCLQSLNPLQNAQGNRKDTDLWRTYWAKTNKPKKKKKEKKGKIGKPNPRQKPCPKMRALPGRRTMPNLIVLINLAPSINGTMDPTIFLHFPRGWAKNGPACRLVFGSLITFRACKYAMHCMRIVGG